MGNYTENALLIDGGTLHGASRGLGRATPRDGAAACDIRSWSFSPGGGDAAPTLADAFAQAVREVPIEDGASLALPPGILVPRVLSLPATDAESLASMVRLKMEELAPVSGDDLEVAYEALGATESATRVFAVAVPIHTLDALAADLEASGLAVTRIDSALLCEWRSISRHTEAARPADGEAAARGLFVAALPSGRFDLFAADESGLLFARSLGEPATGDDLRREITLSLLDIASEHPGFAADRLAFVAPDGTDPRFAEAASEAAGIRAETIREGDLTPYVESALDREGEGGCIDIVPPAWREDEEATQRRRRFTYGAIAAVAVWAVIFGVMTFIPRNIAGDTAAARRKIAAIMPQFSEVAELRTRVRLIQSYEDRTQSVLETLRQLCSEMPDGMTLATFAYEKTDDGSSSGRHGPGGIRATGDAADADSILRLKNALDEAGPFQPARIKGPTMDGQRRRFKFELDWRFKEGAE